MFKYKYFKRFDPAQNLKWFLHFVIFALKEIHFAANMMNSEKGSNRVFWETLQLNYINNTEKNSTLNLVLSKNHMYFNHTHEHNKNKVSHEMVDVIEGPLILFICNHFGTDTLNEASNLNTQNQPKLRVYFLSLEQSAINIYMLLIKIIIFGDVYTSFFSSCRTCEPFQHMYCQCPDEFRNHQLRYKFTFICLLLPVFE